ncbi:MAG: zeta toxin family protein, partial [Vicinamibacterales bacterium]
AEIQRELEAEAADRAPAAPPPPQAAEDVTARTTAQVDADTPGYVRRYRARFGNVLNADNASELFEDYAGSPETRATRVQEVRPAAAKVVEAAYAAALAEPVPEGKQPVAVFTSGGNGSGKSSTVDPDGQQHLVFDSTLSQPAPSAAKIDQALAANHQAVIRHVSRDPVEAWDSVLARAMDEGQGRTVTVAGHDLTHSGARKTLFELADRYAGNPNVTIQVWENGKNGLTPRSVDWLRTQEYPEGDALRRQLLDRVDEALAAGRISPAVAEGARGRLGHRSDGPRDAGGVQPERQRQQGPQGEAPLAPPGPPVTARPRQTTRVRTDAVPPIYHQTIDTADGPKSVATIVAEMQAEGRSEGEIGAWVAGLRRGNAVAVGNPSPSGATVRENADRGGLEVAFEGKPSAEVRDRLKSAGFRWSRAQGLWYRKAKGDTVDDIRALIGQDTAPNTAPVVDAGPPVTPKAENPAAGDDFQPGDRVMYRGTVMTVESPAWQTDFLQLDDGRNGKSRVIRAVVPKAVVRLSAEEAPQKKPKTPQVPNDPDTKYVLPTFATGRGPLRTDTKPGRTTPAAESPGFAVGDRVRADEGSGEVVRLSESGESVKIALDDGGALTKWISVSRVTPLDAGKAGPPVTPSDRIEFEVKSLQTGETSTLTVPTDLPVTPKADKARLVPKRTDGGGVQWVAEPIVPEATADPKAAKRAALAKKRAEARGEIDAALKGIRDALKDQGNTLSAGLPIPPPDLILQTVKLVRAFAKAGIVEIEDGWLSFQDEFGAGYEQVRGAFIKAWSKVHGVAEATVRADLEKFLDRYPAKAADAEIVDAEDDDGGVALLPDRGDRTAPAPDDDLPVEPRQPGPPVTARQRPSDIVKQLRRALGGLPIRERHFRHRAVGIYKPDVHEIRVKVANDLPTIFHEAGHGLDISVLKISRRDARWRDELYALGEATSRPSYTPGQVRKEGAAEFFRLYLMQPSKAEASAPAYFKEFEARLAEHADLRTLLLETRQNIHDYMAQDPATRLRLRIDSTGQGAARGAKQLLTDPKGWLRRQAIHWVDDLKPIRDAVEAMRDDRELDFRHNAYALARLARGAAGKAQGFLEHGVRGRNGRFLSGALADALKPVAAHLDDFVDYLVALRTLELHDTSKRPRAIETGVSVEEARAMIAQVKARPDLETFDQARRAVYAYQDATLEYARQFGALSADQIAKMKALNENYVPFKRVMDDVEASWSGVSRKLANRSVPIRRIKGSGRDIINPLESIIVNTHVLVDMVEKNRAMLALVNQANASVGSARWLTKIPPPQIPTTVNVLDVLGGAVGPRDPSVADFINASGVTEQDMVTMFSPAFMGKPGEQVVTVIRG